MTKIITLSAELDSTQAAGLLAELRQVKGQPVHINGSHVNRISTLCLQILLSASASWKAERTAFQITEPSEALSAAIAMLGLSNDQISLDATN